MEDVLDAPLKVALRKMQDRSLRATQWMGVGAIKCPLDSWIYQELIHETKPDVIIEVGVNAGGGLLFLAHMCDLMGHGRVIGVDCDLARVHQRVRDHPRVSLVEGDAARVADDIENELDGVLGMVIEDSSHTFDNTLRVLRAYSRFVAPGCYLVVEDGICGHGLDIGPQPGPYEAVEAFMAETEDFTLDRGCESFGITWNPKGYLKRNA